MAFASPEEAAAQTTTPIDSFGTPQELTELGGAWPAERFVAIWNSLAGVVPVKKFKNSKKPLLGAARGEVAAARQAAR